MPELPEVENARKNLIKYLLNNKVISLRIHKSGVIKGDLENFKKNILNKSFKKISRRGKLLIIEFNEHKNIMLMHLKMTGQLIINFGDKYILSGHYFPPVKTEDLPGRFTYVQFDFKDGKTLFFNDMRKFGIIKIVSQKELNKELTKYGAEPISKDFTYEFFKNLLKGKETSIKAFLLNQKNIAGIGNIYSDEICFACGILPFRQIKTLSEDDIKSLHKNIVAVLKESIHLGSTSLLKSKKVSEFIKVYKREKQPCKRCKKGIIIKKKVAGRGARFCPNCQK